METTLHRQLKDLYLAPGGQTEARVGRYRIDVLNESQLVEIQHAGLAAIRDKVAALAAKHDILVVKPIIVRKQLIKLKRRGGAIVSRRLSPKRGGLLDVFDELVHFTRALALPRLTLEVPLVEIEELRYPGHGHRRWRRPGDHEIEDQRLVSVHATHRFAAPRDLLRLLPTNLPHPFHTGQLAERLNIARWTAQRIAYVLRETGVLASVGKQGRARLYVRALKRTSRMTTAA
jgi:hypothetical protein